MDYFNELPELARIVIIILFILFTTMTIAIVFMAPIKINAIKKKENIGYERSKLSKILNIVFYIVVLVWYIFAIVTDYLTTLFLAYFAAMILFIIYRYMKTYMKRKETRMYPLYYTNEVDPSIVEGFQKRYHQAKFFVTPSNKPTSITINDTNENKHKQILDQLKEITGLFKDLSTDAFQVNELRKQKILLVSLGLFDILAIILLFTSTVL